MLRAPALARHFGGIFCRVTVTPQPRGERRATGEARAAAILLDDRAPKDGKVFLGPCPRVLEARVAQQLRQPTELTGNDECKGAVSVALPALWVARVLAVLLEVLPGALAQRD